MTEGEGDYVRVPRKTYEAIRRTAEEAEEAFDDERTYFQKEGHYRNSNVVVNYISATETGDPKGAAGKWYDVARENLTAEIPDFDMLKTAASHLRKLHYDANAKEIERQTIIKRGRTREAVEHGMRGAGAGEETVMRARRGMRSGLTSKFAKAILVMSLVGIMGLASGGVTGAVTGAARTSAAWNVVLALIALLSGLFLVANKE